MYPMCVFFAEYWRWQCLCFEIVQGCAAKGLLGHKANSTLHEYCVTGFGCMFSNISWGNKLKVYMYMYLCDIHNILIQQYRI